MQDQSYKGSRKNIAMQILEENPCHVLIEAKKHEKSTLDCFSKKHLLVPLCSPVHVFKEELRKRIGSIGKNYGLYLYIQNSLVKESSTMGELYKKHKDADGFLIIEFSEIASFGQQHSHLYIRGKLRSKRHKQ